MVALTNFRFVLAIASHETNIVNIVYIGPTSRAHIVICVLSHESCDTCIVHVESQIISDVSSWYEQSNFRAICCNKLLQMLTQLFRNKIELFHKAKDYRFVTQQLYNFYLYTLVFYFIVLHFLSLVSKKSRAPKN